ncbi:MAG: aspartate-semialdehyde dehydrogenase [Solirubrobacteraceae bacterium]
MSAGRSAGGMVAGGRSAGGPLATDVDRRPSQAAATAHGSGLRIAVLGATGAVGTVMLQCLRERGLDQGNEIVAFATERSAGRVIGGHTVVTLNDDADLSGIDIALFSAGGATARAWAPRFVAAGATVIDNSSAFRRDPGVPLVVAEVNPDALRVHRGLIANPNCSTMQLMVALAPIHRAVGIQRLVVATYQSVSGTGRRAIDALDAEARALLAGSQPPAPEVYPETIAFNVIGAAGNFADGDDHTDEERKMMFETRKILEDQEIGIAVTCVRVPVRVSHSEAVNIQTREPLSVDRALELLAAAPGIVLEDVPSPLRATGRDEVFVGRVRADDSHPRAFSMFVVADNLRKGAATNAVQIAELLIAQGIVSARSVAAAVP